VNTSGRGLPAPRAPEAVVALGLPPTTAPGGIALAHKGGRLSDAHLRPTSLPGSTRLHCASSLIVPMAKNRSVRRAAPLGTNSMDTHLGLRIRQRRRLLGMSQGALGAATGLSVKTIQRHESGFTAIPARSLFELAKALSVQPSYLFQGSRLTAGDPLHSQETMTLVRAYSSIHNPSVRKSIAEAIRAIATLSHQRG
jgi:transcriptional regulator with XRE-family HTH domain